MATQNENALKYSDLYELILARAESFSFKNPDSLAGYNELISIAKIFRRDAVLSGAPTEEIPPLPPKKEK
jgi:hypothetical protein